MNKKEIAEIRKTFKADKCCIDKVCACYVMPNKERIIIPLETFASLEEDFMDKYLEIFKKAIGGTIGKQLHCLEFPTDEELDGGSQYLLYELNLSGLDDDERLEELYDKIIDNYESDGYYCILLMHANYDIVSKASDESALDSEDVYSHIICAICPTNLSKPVLSYNQSKNKIEDAKRMWVIAAPQNAFLFPTLSDRMSDIHEVLVFDKKSTELNIGIIEGVLGCSLPTSAEQQADAFTNSTQSAFDDKITFEQISNIYDDLTDRLENARSEDELLLSKDAVRQVLEQADATNIAAFEETYENSVGDKDIYLENIVDKNKFVIKMDGVTISANSETKQLISVKEVDGQKCIVILPNGDLNVDGITAKLF